MVKIPVSVNGEGPFTFDLDTGASLTTLSKKLAETLGIITRQGSRSEARGVGGSIPIEYADAAISIGALEFESDEVYVLDFDKIRLGAKNRDGVLGFTTLRHCMMSLNYSKQSFKLSRNRSISKKTTGDYVRHPFEYIKDSHLVGVPVHVNSEGPFDFVLDTGAGNSVITPELADRLCIEAKPVQGIARGVGGDVELKLAGLEQISVHSATLVSPQVVVLDLSKVSPKGKLIENGIIGYDFLKNFETIIDYPKKQFSFIDERS